jgi:hypothetical protein
MRALTFILNSVSHDAEPPMDAVSEFGAAGCGPWYVVDAAHIPPTRTPDQAAAAAHLPPC